MGKEKETALPKNIRQIGEIRGREKVYIEDYVMTCIHKKESQEKEGYFGIFYGEQRKEEDGIYLFIRGILEIPDGDEEEAVKKELEEQKKKYFPDWEVQGCCVIGVYPTERMKLAEKLNPASMQLIYHLQEQEEHLYWTVEGCYKKLHGYFVFYEQNRRMQQYLAEEFKEDRVEKESIPDKAMKSFREKVRMKGEKRTGSMLRLAGSFFVVSVLVIGAIAVTRMDDIRQKQADGARMNTEENEADRIYTNEPALQGGNRTASDGLAAKQEVTTETAAKEAAKSAGAGAQGQVAAAQPTGADAQGQSAAAQPAGMDVQGQTEASQPAGADAQGQPEAAQPTGAALQDASQGTTDAADANLASTASSQVADQLDASAGTNTADTGNTGAATASADANTADAQPTMAASAAAQGIHASYTIRVGDTLADICSKYYGSLDQLEQLCEVNHISDANLIMPGQKIVLP